MTLLVGEQEEEEKVDYEALKQELAAMVLSQRRAMINHLRQAQTLANPKEVELLRRNQASFQKSYAQILEQLELLKAGASLDLSELENDLQPIASGLHQFLKFTEKIYEEIEIVNEQIKDAQVCDNADDLEILKENIEALFENCDHFAEELDELESQGMSIDAVIEHYEVLRVTVEQFENVVQDAANRIGITSGSLS